MWKLPSVAIAGLATFILGFYYLINPALWLVLLLLGLWVVFVSWDVMVNGFPGDRHGRWDGPHPGWGWSFLNIVFGAIVAGVAMRAAFIWVSPTWFIILGLCILFCAAIAADRT